MTALDRYQALIDARREQRDALGLDELNSDRWSEHAPSYRFDPRRELDANLAEIATLVGPDDHVVDVGGGAGRVGLPLALRCRPHERGPASAWGRVSRFLLRRRASRIATLERPLLDAEAEGELSSARFVYFVRRSTGSCGSSIAPLAPSRHLDLEPRPPARNPRLFEIAHAVRWCVPPDHRELLR